MMSLVEQMFKVHGKHITDENLATMKSWVFPNSDNLSAVVDVMYDAFVHVVITEEDIYENYLCFMLERHAEFLDGNSIDGVNFAKAEEIQGLIYEAFEDECAFLTTYLCINNDILDDADDPFQQTMTTISDANYGDTLLRAVWIDKLLESKNANLG